MKFLHRLFNIAASIGAGIFGAYVFTLLWAWFVVPLGAPALTVPMAAGVLIVAAFPTAPRAVLSARDRQLASDAFKKAKKDLGDDAFVDRIVDTAGAVLLVAAAAISLLAAYVWSLFL